MLSSCRTTETKTEYAFPTLEAFKPSDVPEDLIAEPQTDVDLLQNSVAWEYWGYDWQDYALSLEQHVMDIKDVIMPP